MAALSTGHFVRHWVNFAPEASVASVSANSAPIAAVGMSLSSPTGIHSHVATGLNCIARLARRSERSAEECLNVLRREIAEIPDHDDDESGAAAMTFVDRLPPSAHI